MSGGLSKEVRKMRCVYLTLHQLQIDRYICIGFKYKIQNENKVLMLNMYFSSDVGNRYSRGTEKEARVA